MSKLSKLFGAKPNKEKQTEEPSLRPEDITLFVQSPVQPKSAEELGDDFGLQFHLLTGDVKSFASLPIVIGRGKGNEIDLADDSVSAIHARIYFDERVGSICIEDQNSLNGIFVNNLPTTKNILRDGDKIKIGNLEMTFKDTGFIYQGS
jgi:pSer/pThr/pTyr-binding forkhead associated (FHA) protein